MHIASGLWYFYPAVADCTLVIWKMIFILKMNTKYFSKKGAQS